MDPLLEVLLQPYIGGELEISSPFTAEDGYRYRGQILAISATSPQGTTPGKLTIKLAWRVKAVNAQGELSNLPTGGWVEDTELSYTCRTQHIFQHNENYGREEFELTLVPCVSLEEDKIVVMNPNTNEVAMLFRNDGDKLDQNKVRWLADDSRTLQAHTGN
ncbi:MAG TPA: hypothetical protein VFO38_06150 [Candidatus Saccharimonadales bacterium]|nr:hypothetical protein [Candidatus Saccharimonadales bacterium]